MSTFYHVETHRGGLLISLFCLSISCFGGCDGEGTEPISPSSSPVIMREQSISPDETARDLGAGGEVIAGEEVGGVSSSPDQGLGGDPPDLGIEPPPLPMDMNPPQESATALRYLRITTLESPSWVSWFEVEVIAITDERGGLENLALGATFVASSTEESSSVDALHDGDHRSAWNAGNFAPAVIDIDLGRRALIHEVRLLVAQNPSGSTTHSLEGSVDGERFELLERFEEDTAGGQWLVYHNQSSPLWGGDCAPLEFNLIMQQTSQPCSDCAIWFWGMGAPEQRPRLEVEYSDGTGGGLATFQAGPLGTHGELWGARILGENPYWGPGSCPMDEEDCPEMFLHHLHMRGTYDGAPLWHGVLRGDLSVIPCDATITSAKLHLHINEDEGLANADHTSAVAIHRGLKIWNPRWVNGRRYDRDTINGVDRLWDSLGGDFGEFIMELRAQEDFWDRGFHKAAPRAWFDVTEHVTALQDGRAP